jgi:hypothetical protein
VSVDDKAAGSLEPNGNVIASGPSEIGEDDDAGNRVVGATARSVLEFVAQSITEDPGAVVVEAREGKREVQLRLHVGPDDVGRVIGRQGRVAKAIRTVVGAAGARDGVAAPVEIVSD